MSPVKLLTVGMTLHDHNISYFDGEQVRYCKFERIKQIKHFKFDTLWEWIKEAEDTWGIKIEDIDEIALDLDPDKVSMEFFNSKEYQGIYTSERLYYKIPDKSNPFTKYGVKNIWHINHHYAHSLSSWMLEDPNNRPSIRVVVDGAGDGRTVTVFKHNKLIKFIPVTNGSIGFGMEEIGTWLGIDSFLQIDHPGKIMGLQSYGNIDFEFLKTLEQFGMDEVSSIFDRTLWAQHKKDEFLSRMVPLDWVKTVHERVGDLLVEFFSTYADPDDVISYTGGVAQNVIWNTKLIKKFKNLIIPPHSSDEGTSLGSLEFLRIRNNLPPMKLNNFPYVQSDVAPSTAPNKDAVSFAADALSKGKIVGWYQGHGEIGPRALGHRSILMDPRIPNGKEIINAVKKRENYRPFGASILQEHLNDYFIEGINDRYMLFVNTFKKSGFESITHVDGTCRVQSVSNDGGSFRQLLEEFYALTGCPILLNTSLNVNGKPIAGYTESAKDLFYSSPIDYMIIGDEILKKQD